jgi:hypothetical protein
MGTEVWYLRPWLWLQRLAAGIGWLLFVWGTGYKGFVCDHADMDPLPCDLWWQEQDAGEEKTVVRLQERGEVGRPDTGPVHKRVPPRRQARVGA